MAERSEELWAAVRDAFLSARIKPPVADLAERFKDYGVSRAEIYAKMREEAWDKQWHERWRPVQTESDPQEIAIALTEMQRNVMNQRHLRLCKRLQVAGEAALRRKIKTVTPREVASMGTILLRALDMEQKLTGQTLGRRTSAGPGKAPAPPLDPERVEAEAKRLEELEAKA